MLEDAKAISAKANIIALARAAIGIENVLISSVYSMVRNPSWANNYLVR